MTGPLWSSLPMGWGRGKVKHLASVTLGKMLQSSDSGGDTLALYLRAANIQPDGVLDLKDTKEMWFNDAELQSLDLQAGDVVVVEGGNGYGRAAFLSEGLGGFGYQNSVNRLRPHDHTDGRFLSYYLIALRASGFIQAHCNLVSMPHLTAEKLAVLPLPIPPPDEQGAIADYLDRETARIDELITEQERLLEVLTERRHAVMSSVFGAHVGVGDRLKWHIDETDIRAGERATALPLLSVSISWGVRRRDEVSNERSRAESLSTYKICSRGDLVINRMRAFQGALGLAPEEGVVSPDYAVLKIKPGVNPEWLVGAMRTSAFVSEMARRVKGIGSAELGNARTPRINISDLGEIRLRIPGRAQQDSEQAEVTRQVARLDRLALEAERFIELARERRSALITAAVTGQIDVGRGS